MAIEKERRSAPRKSPARSAPPAPAQARSGRSVEVSPDEIKRLIAEAAYYRAKARGFTPGHELEDWIQAEAEVTRRLEPRQ